MIVPDGVLFGSSKAHKQLRQELIERQQLQAVISMPGGVFKPYAGVSTAVLIFTRTDSAGTDNVWFYDMRADGYTLDDKRTPLLTDEQMEAQFHHAAALSEPALSRAEVPKGNTNDLHERFNIADILARFGDPAETKR